MLNTKNEKTFHQELVKKTFKTIQKKYTVQIFYRTVICNKFINLQGDSELILEFDNGWQNIWRQYKNKQTTKKGLLLAGEY